MANLQAYCPTCGRVWLVAELPMEVSIAGRLAKAARCACGSSEKPRMPTGPIIRLATLRARLATLNSMRKLVDSEVQEVLQQILEARREDAQLYRKDPQNG